MSENVNIYFKCKGRMYTLMMKTSGENITLSMLVGRICTKLELDESKVKLQLRYNAVLLGSTEEIYICDDEDVGVYISSGENNRRYVLYVEVITPPELPEQLSRVEVINKSYAGKNYEDEMRDNAAIVLCECEEQGTEPKEAIVEVDDTQDAEIGSQDESMDIHDDRGDEYVEPPPVVEAGQFKKEWEDGIGLNLFQEFPSRAALQEVVDKGAFANSFGYVIKKSDKERYLLTCAKESCAWRIRASNIQNTSIYSIRKYNKMHTCTRISKSKTRMRKRKGTPELVAALLHDTFPGQMETPVPKVIMELVQTKLGVKISYSTALRGKRQAICDLKGSAEDSYKDINCYLYMLKKVNEGTITYLKLDEEDKFQYLFIALGASIEGFQVMRKVIIVDATHLKNGYGGVLVFASAQDPNRHHYIIAIGVLDSENDASWGWFFEKLLTVVPDTPELVFMSDRNSSLIKGIRNVYFAAHHGYCIWHLSQNVKGHATNVNRDVVAWRFMELSRVYTMAEFEREYRTFKLRYPSAANYLEDTTVKEKWARCCFRGQRYNLDTSNCVESLNSVFLNARKYSLIPMLDAIISKISVWFNEHRKEAASGSNENKLVPLVENYLHDLWVEAEKLKVTELNTFQLEYNVRGSEGKEYFVNLLLKTCSCKVFDIQKYPCVHALAGFIAFENDTTRTRSMEIHELVSKYYWAEMWALAYYRTIYLVPDKSQWDIPDDIKALKLMNDTHVFKWVDEALVNEVEQLDFQVSVLEEEVALLKMGRKKETKEITKMMVPFIVGCFLTIVLVTWYN
ncbi:Zinc finger SWIM-type [Arabidopsis suecica]|uniref:Zinc finger SWIM-type n=1 Tax=Arabidopsis suecica TaxID=45249 RepID=A0A8T2AKT1_ARASU|nr:Zinc finger SWIM-type [Arabidopsis suecica]